MNRTIKFRGKRLDDGEWVYGSLAETHGKLFIGIPTDPDNPVYKMDWYAVDPASVGQFTGLLDKNGREIYEGDVVLQRGYSGMRPMAVKFEQGAFIVGWHGGSSTQTRPMLIQKRCEVLGNIHDNKLLNEK